MKPNSKFVIGGVTTAGTLTVVTATIDTRGFNFARIICLAGATNTHGLSTTAADNKLEESDNSTASFTAISAAAAGTAYTPTSASNSTALAKLVYEVDLRGRKRYLKPTFGAAATGEYMIVAELSQPSDGVVTASENGAAFLVQI